MRETKRQQITGTVVSDKMDKTVVLEIETQMQHPKYNKYIKRRKRYKAHDETNECRLGDVVRCMETRPLSKDKRWRVVEILRRKYVSTAEVSDPLEVVLKKYRKRMELKQQAEAEKAAEQAAEQAAAQQAQEPQQEEEAQQEQEPQQEAQTQETETHTEPDAPAEAEGAHQDTKLGDSDDSGTEQA